MSDDGGSDDFALIASLIGTPQVAIMASTTNSNEGADAEFYTTDEERGEEEREEEERGEEEEAPPPVGRSRKPMRDHVARKKLFPHSHNDFNSTSSSVSALQSTGTQYSIEDTEKHLEEVAGTLFLYFT